MTSAPTENGKKVLTMAEYIEMEALRNSVESIDWYSVYKGKLTAGAPNTENALYKANSIYAVIDNAPSADVAPVRHGEWEVVVGSDGKEHMVCTCCRVSQDLTGVFTYCPNCGAKMDLE